MSDIKHSPINQKHLQWQFANDPLIVAVAAETGCTSIDKAEDLPESLRYLKDQLPGILFQHHPLGGAPVVPQFRPDTPVDGGPKYIFPKNSGSVISITPTMQSRLDEDVTKSSRVLIVEGTKQMLFAAAYAPTTASWWESKVVPDGATTVRHSAFSTVSRMAATW